MAEGDFPAAGGPGERSNIAMFAIPLLAERESLRHSLRQGWFLLLGVAVVVRLTLLRTGTGALGSANYAKLTPLRFGSLFLSGAVAITAMVLPGISGSGYTSPPSGLSTASCGSGWIGSRPLRPGPRHPCGVGLSIHAIRTALRKYRGRRSG